VDKEKVKKSSMYFCSLVSGMALSL